jgi:predicted dehydrogenase
MQIAAFNFEYRPSLPVRSDYGIGIVGCGGIVNYAHLPAYRSHGLHIVACHDRDYAKATQTAADHAIPQVYATLHELLADPAIEIVDIAVPAWEQRAIAEQALAAGKHLLCQKPLAEQLTNRYVAVNQQMRWSPLIAASHELLRNGIIGDVTDAQIHVSIATPWQMWPWLRDTPRLDIMYHSIHYLDSLRHLFGQPEWVTSRHTKHPGQPERAETKTITILDYAHGMQALVAVNHHDHSTDTYATLRILGTQGVIKGTIGLLYDYPTGRADTLQFCSDQIALGVWHSIELEGRWIPDAFIGPMAALMAAIQDGQPPVTSASDNLGTLQVVHAAYLSAAGNRSIRPCDL